MAQQISFTFLSQFFWEFRKDDALSGSWFGRWLKKHSWQTVPWTPLMWESPSGLWSVQVHRLINQGWWPPPAHSLGCMQTTQNLFANPSARFARRWQKIPGNNSKADSEKGENEQLKGGTSRETQEAFPLFLMFFLLSWQTVRNCSALLSTFSHGTSTASPWQWLLGGHLLILLWPLVMSSWLQGFLEIQCCRFPQISLACYMAPG